VPIALVGELKMSEVSFTYDGQTPALEDVSFVIPAGEVVGIVGPSGSGKSTLVQLLLGVRRATVGQVQVDGVEIGEFDRNQWARTVTFVPQKLNLIEGTIEDNIRFFRTDVDLDDVVRAAKLAHIHDEILSMPGGYGRALGGEGGALSGGQQQRLCIARALVEQPSLLILDEPTSALDMRSEHLIRQTLEGLRESMTVVIIAHRLSTLNMCDRLMVIQDGRLAGFDVPSRLAESSEFYREALELSRLD